MSPIKFYHFLPVVFVAVAFVVCTAIDTDPIPVRSTDVPTLDTSTPEPALNDAQSQSEKEDEDMDAAATGAIDTNLINSNYVGRYNGNPCKELGEKSNPQINFD